MATSTVTRTLIVVRILYFVIAISHASTYQWSILYFNDYFNLSEFGLIHGSRFLFRFVGSLIWGRFGDYWPTKKFHLFFIAQMFGILCMTSLYFLPSVPSIPLFTIYSIRVSYQFIFTLIAVCGEQYGSSSFVLLEALTLILSGREYGSHRFYVAFGHAFGSLLCASIEQLSASHSIFILIYNVSIIIGLIILTIQILSEGAKQGHKRVDSVENSDNINVSITNVLFNPGFILMITNVFIFGVGQSIVLEYLFLFILNDFNADEIVCGLTTMVMVLGELIIFYNSKYLLIKIGILGLDFLAHISYIIRVYYYTLLPLKPHYAYFILLVEIMHGFTFAGYWISSVEYMDKVTPIQHKSTVMGILSGVFYGFSYMIGSIVGGFMYQMYGAVFMYRLWATIICIWMATYNCAFHILIRIDRRQILYLQ